MKEKGEGPIIEAVVTATESGTLINLHGSGTKEQVDAIADAVGQAALATGARILEEDISPTHRDGGRSFGTGFGGNHPKASKYIPAGDMYRTPTRKTDD